MFRTSKALLQAEDSAKAFAGGSTATDEAAPMGWDAVCGVVAVPEGLQADSATALSRATARWRLVQDWRANRVEWFMTNLRKAYFGIV